MTWNWNLVCYQATPISFPSDNVTGLAEKNGDDKSNFISFHTPCNDHTHRSAKNLMVPRLEILLNFHSCN